MKPRWDRITLLLGLWAFVGLLLSVEVFFTLRVMNPAVLYVDVAVSQFQRAALWVVLAPLVLWLGKCVPFESGKKFRATLFHLTLSLVIMAVYYLARLLYAVQEEHVPWSDFWNVAQSSFFGRNLIDTVYYWAVLALGYVYQLQQGYREKELRSAQLEARLAEAELQVLKRQLQPHFLFNTMNTIAVLVREGDNQKAVQLIAKLSSLLRLSLDSERSVETNLRGELEFLRLYVEIQKARFPDRLQYRVEIPEELLDRRVPSLLLQPLVENAIIHGIAPKESGGSVLVRASLEAGTLRLEVSDDGAGFDTKAEVKGRRGIGISNTQARLLRLYGYRASLTIQSKPGQGTSCLVLLPA